MSEDDWQDHYNRQENWPMGWTIQEILDHVDALEEQVRTLTVDVTVAPSKKLIDGLLHMVGYCMKIGDYLFDAVAESAMTVETATEIASMCDERWSTGGEYSNSLRFQLERGGFL